MKEKNKKEKEKNIKKSKMMKDNYDVDIKEIKTGNEKYKCIMIELLVYFPDKPKKIKLDEVLKEEMILDYLKSITPEIRKNLIKLIRSFF